MVVNNRVIEKLFIEEPEIEDSEHDPLKYLIVQLCYIIYRIYKIPEYV